ncbi:MAG: hypothetical protein K0R66_711 [Gammaproteobacteria bacterium]|jgi:uncharacterized protein (TIGR00251 family)|nr:hypothetical protein [Gammaproteobacteria bacterium]
MKAACYWQNDALFLRLHVQPNSKKNEWLGLYGERLKLKLHAPAVDGKANQALIKFLAAFLKVKKSQLSLISGELSRDKLIKILPPITIESQWAIPCD